MEIGMRSHRSRMAICTTWIGPCLLLAGLSAGAALAQTEEWPTASPESQGLSSATIAAYEDRVAAGEYGQVDSLLIVRRGFLVSEASFGGWTAGALHPAFSVTKSVTTTLVAIAAGSWLTAPLGARATHRWPTAIIKKIFAGLLYVLGVRMAYSLLAG